MKDTRWMGTASTCICLLAAVLVVQLVCVYIYWLGPWVTILATAPAYTHTHTLEHTLAFPGCESYFDKGHKTHCHQEPKSNKINKEISKCPPCANPPPPREIHGHHRRETSSNINRNNIINSPPMKKQIYRPHVSISQGSSDIFLHFLFSSSIRFVDFFFYLKLTTTTLVPVNNNPNNTRQNL